MPPATIRTFTGQSHLVLNGPALAEVLRGPQGPVMRHMIVLGERVKNEAIRIAPRVTSNLAHHIVKRVTEKDGRPTVLVGVENVPYAIWVHEGANPHEIRARNAPRLVFFWEKVGSLVAFPVVQHPGNKPNRFLERALRTVQTTGGG